MMAKKSISSANISVISGSTQNLVPVNTRQRYFKGRTKFEKKLILGFVCLIVLSILLLTGCAVIGRLYDELVKAQVCTSSECVETSIQLMQSMNKSADPCHDFYNYACGKFPLEYPVKDDLYNSWFNEKSHRLNLKIKNVLEGGNIEEDIKPVREIKLQYKSCLDTGSLESLGLHPLYDVLRMVQLPQVVTKETAEKFNLGKTLGLAQRHLSKDMFVALSLSKINSDINPNDPRNMTILKITPYKRGIQFKELKLPLDILTIDRRINRPFIFGDEDEMREEFVVDEDDEPGVPLAVSSKKVVNILVKFIAQVMEEVYDDLERREQFPDSLNSTGSFLEAFKILAFQAELQEINEPAVSFAEQMTFSSLQIKLDEYVKEESSNTRIVWKDYVEGLFHEHNNTYDVEGDVIYVENFEYLKQLTKVLTKSKPESIQRYVWWLIVQDFAKHTTSNMREIYHRLAVSLYGNLPFASRQETCVDVCRKLMNIAIGYDMAKSDNYSDAVYKIREMLYDIQDVFEGIVRSKSWMDEMTKLITLDKAKAITNHIGYPDWMQHDENVVKYYHQLNFRKDEYMMNIVRQSSWEVKGILDIVGPDRQTNETKMSWFTEPLQVNAFYSRLDNSVTIPAGILQSPFYFKGLESLNYGAIGMILGHELTHGFDIEGKNFNKYGERENWWSRKMLQEFNKRASCFIKQYSKEFYYLDKRLNGSRTLSENIADNGGLRESVLAYRQFKSRHDEERKLPGFEDFTSEQLLFLSFANMWCESTTDRYQRATGYDSHSPHKIRVTLTLQNIEEFSQAFQCPLGSKMNPEHKCIIW